MAEEPPVNTSLYGDGMVIRQSDLSAWMRCNLQKHYYDVAKVDATAMQPKTLSRTVWGTVLHHVIQTMEDMQFNKMPEVLETSLSTFEYYWKPENLDQVAEPIDEWMLRDTYGGLRDRARTVITQYYELLKNDPSNLLALEYGFAVPLEVDGRVHTLVGTIDRLSLRMKYSRPYVSVDDWKSGKKPRWLRYSVQGTSYCYATTRPEFWQPPTVLGTLQGFDDTTLAAIEAVFGRRRFKLHEGSPEPAKWTGELAPRGFRWIDLSEGKHSDGGYRDANDYERLRLAVSAYVRANEAQIFMPTMTGDTCQWCSFRDGCGGLGFSFTQEEAV
jgi:hypothetical protein